MREWRDRLMFWWESRGAAWWIDLAGRWQGRWDRFEYWRRTKNPELVELDAFRALVGLEKQLEEWPRAIPLLEQALKAYDVTHQPAKREAMRKRLEAVDPANPNVQTYFKAEEKCVRKAAAEKVNKMTEDQR